MSGESVSAFETAARSQPRGGFAREVCDFVWSNKKWWLFPIFIVLLLFAVLLSLAGSGAAPFIYTLF